MAGWYEKALKQKPTPANVRNAMLECFKEAGKIAFGKDFPQLEPQLEGQIKRVFETIGADYENPSKRDMLRAVEEIKKTICQIVDEKIIEEHNKKIIKIINRMK